MTFHFDIEPELDIEPDFDDPNYTREIKERRETHPEAWCCITVTAQWNGFEGTDTLGGVSLDCGEHPSGHKVARAVEKHARDNGMPSEALDALNSDIASTFARLAPLLEGRGDVKRKLIAAQHELGDHSDCVDCEGDRD